MTSRPDEHADATDAGPEHVLAVAIDERGARILDVHLDGGDVEHTEQHVRDDDPRSRHLRTVERHTGRDDERDLDHFFDELAADLATQVDGSGFVVLGHGHGKSDAAAGFVKRLKDKHHELARRVVAVGNVDLSADSDTELEKAAIRLVREAAGRPDGDR